METDKRNLQRTMTSSHIMMMALGGAIGAGLFKGSSSAIDMAGPSVIIAYLIGGIILLFIMQGLAEMAVRNSGARTFQGFSPIDFRKVSCLFSRLDLLENVGVEYCGRISGCGYFHSILAAWISNLDTCISRFRYCYSD